MAKKKQIVTPFGRVAWATLQRPSYKFDKVKGAFSCRLVFDDTDEVAEFIGTLRDAYEGAYNDELERQRQDKPALKEIKRADPPFRRPQDPDTGEELPGWEVNASIKHKAIGKENGRDVVLFTSRPAVQDSRCRPVTDELGAGTLARMSVLLNPFFVASAGAGLSLRLVGVQVKEYVAPGAGDPGFEEIEGGFEFQPPRPVEVVTAGTEDAPATAAAPEEGEW